MRVRWANRLLPVVLAGLAVALSGAGSRIVAEPGVQADAGVEVVLPSLETRRLCGVNAAYVALRLLGDEIRFGEVVDAFPQVEARGVTLQEVGEFLKHRGVAVKLARMSEAELARRAGQLGIFLLPGDEMSHMVVKRVVAGGVVQTLDPPGPLVGHGPGSHDRRRRAVLLVGDGNGSGVGFARLPVMAVGLGLLAAGSGLLWWNRMAAARISLLLTGTLLVAGCGGGQSGVHVPEPLFDAGALEVAAGGVELGHRFRIENLGDRPLRILEVVGSCGCLRLEAPAMIPSQSSGNVAAALRLTRADIDPKAYRIAVRTDDPVSPLVTLEFRARAKPSPYAVPGRMVIGSASAEGEPLRCRIHFPSRMAVRRFIDGVMVVPSGCGVTARTENPTRQARIGGLADGLFMYSAELVLEGGHIPDCREVQIRFVDGRTLSVHVERADDSTLAGDAQFSVSRARQQGNTNP